MRTPHDMAGMWNTAPAGEEPDGNDAAGDGDGPQPIGHGCVGGAAATGGPPGPWPV